MPATAEEKIEKEQSGGVLSPKEAETASDIRDKGSTNNEDLSEEIGNTSISQATPSRGRRHSLSSSGYSSSDSDLSHSRYSNHPTFASRNQNPSKNIGVFGLSHRTDEEHLKRKFEKFGKIVDVKLVYNTFTGVSKGYGFIEFEMLECATSAKERMNGSRIDGKYVRTDYSFTQRPHPRTPGIYMGRKDLRFNPEFDRYEHRRGRHKRKRYHVSRSRSRSLSRSFSRERSTSRGRQMYSSQSNSESESRSRSRYRSRSRGRTRKRERRGRRSRWASRSHSRPHRSHRYERSVELGDRKRRRKHEYY